MESRRSADKPFLPRARESRRDRAPNRDVRHYNDPVRAVPAPGTIVRSLASAVVVAVLASCAVTWAAESLSPAEAIRHVGATMTVCGPVASARYAAHAKGQPTFLNLGKPFPDQELTALIWGRQRGAFSYLPESLAGQTICVHGVISTYQGKAQIVVSQPSQIRRER